MVSSKYMKILEAGFQLFPSSERMASAENEEGRTGNIDHERDCPLDFCTGKECLLCQEIKVPWSPGSCASSSPLAHL